MDCTVETYPGISSIPEAEWSRLLPDEGEGWAYYKAVEPAPPPGFRFESIAVRQAGKIIAAAPIFRIDYRLDTPLQGRLRGLGEWLYRTFPRLVAIPVMGLGSPLTERCHLGFEPSLGALDRQRVLTMLLDGLAAHAERERVPMLAIKDLADSEAAMLDPAIRAAGFARIASLPTCVLDLPFKSEAEYIQSLSANNRSTLRRKIKSAGKVETEVVTSIAGLEDEIYDLYEETRKHSRFDYGDFEQLSPGYFRDVMRSLGPQAACILCRVDGRLLAFKLMFIEKERVIDKFWGMRYPEGRDHNLFFVAWMAAIRFTIAHGAVRYQSGQTAYAQKVKLGSRLDQLWVYYRHRGRLSNRIVGAMAPYAAFDRLDPELVEIRARAAAARSATPGPHVAPQRG